MREKKNLFIAITTSLLLIVTALPAEALDKGKLLLYLPFDTDKGKIAKDATGKTNGGNIIGGAKFAGGIRGKGLELDGESGYVEIELTPEMIEAERNSFAAELWLQTQAKGPRIRDDVIRVFKGYLIFGGFGPIKHTKGHWSMFFFSDVEGEDKFRFSVLNVNTGAGSDGPGVTTDRPKINDGKWHHIAAVRDEDAKELRAYIDGEFVGRVDDVTRSLNSRPEERDKIRDKIWLGVHVPGHEENPGTGYFPVMIDEVRFWGKAMNEADAVRIMSLAVDPSEKLPLTWGEVKANYMGVR